MGSISGAGVLRRARLLQSPTIYITIEIDSEGPESRLTLRPGPDNQSAIFEVHDVYSPAVYFVADVEAKQLGLALAEELRAAIHDPLNRQHWNDWYGDDEDLPSGEPDYFGNTWLRNLVIEQHTSGDDHSHDTDTRNEANYPSARYRDEVAVLQVDRIAMAKISMEPEGHGYAQVLVRFDNGSSHSPTTTLLLEASEDLFPDLIGFMRKLWSQRLPARVKIDLTFGEVYELRAVPLRDS